MKGFEKDNWTLHDFRDGWKTVFHRKYKFIRIDLVKIQKGFDYNDPVWRASVKSWNLRDKKHRAIHVSYKRFTKNRIPEIFEKLLKIDSVKEAIFNHLFEGKI